MFTVMGKEESGAHTKAFHCLTPEVDASLPLLISHLSRIWQRSWEVQSPVFRAGFMDV